MSTSADRRVDGLESARPRSLFPRLSIRSLLANDEEWTREITSQSRRLAAQLRQVTDSELAVRTEQLREHSADIRQSSADMSMAAGVVMESLRRSYSINLYDVQLRAGLTMCRGKIAEMQTGEGKTFSGVLPTYIFALPGKGVHVCAPNSYLASRDQQLLVDVFRRLGMTTASRQESDPLDVARRAYAADVTYAAGQVFGFDYLRDQWTRRQWLQAPMGTITAGRLIGQGIENQIRGRGLFSAVIDEADHVLVDDATSPLLITTGNDRPAPDADLHLFARSVARSLAPDTSFRLDKLEGAVRLTDGGFRDVYQYEDMATSDRLCRPWHEYVTAALKAELVLKRDRHYVVQDGELRLVELSTGRIFEDRTWSGGLHQAVQAKEGLKVTAETASQGRITRQAFFQAYEHLCGMTGTASACRQELKSIYRLEVIEIPTRMPSRREVLELCVSKNLNAKYDAITEEVRRVLAQRRAVLIGTNHIDQSVEIAARLRAIGIATQVLNGLQTRDEAEIVGLAGREGAVTVATHLAGRGTDIPLDDAVAEAGGLHVIACEHHRLDRVDRQLIGRGARQGDPGTARFYISPDDRFVTEHAPYLAAFVVRALGNPDSIRVLCRSIESAQRRLADEDRQIRFHQMKKNSRPGSALAKIGAGTSKANSNRGSRTLSPRGAATSRKSS